MTLGSELGCTCVAPCVEAEYTTRNTDYGQFSFVRTHKVHCTGNRLYSSVYKTYRSKSNQYRLIICFECLTLAVHTDHCVQILVNGTKVSSLTFDVTRDRRRLISSIEPRTVRSPHPGGPPYVIIPRVLRELSTMSRRPIH